MADNKEIIFNSSLPRSGSELLQVILHQNPLIYASPTSPALEFLHQTRIALATPEFRTQPHETMNKAYLNMCKSMLPAFYEEVTDRPIVCDKSRGWMAWYPWLQNIYGNNPKMVCMVRDIRAIIASMEKNYRKNQHLTGGTTNPNELKGLTLEDRVTNWVTKEPPCAFALTRLLGAIDSGHYKYIHFIKYEQLMANPQETMNGLYDYLGIDHFEHDFDNLNKEVEENHHLFGPYGDHEVKPKLEATPPDFEEVLGINLCQRIVNGNSWFYNTFYS